MQVDLRLFYDEVSSGRRRNCYNNRKYLACSLTDISDILWFAGNRIVTTIS